MGIFSLLGEFLLALMGVVAAQSVIAVSDARRWRMQLGRYAIGREFCHGLGESENQ